MTGTSLYRHYNSEGELLYVGVSLSALQRLGQHAECSEWFKSIASVTIEHFETRDAALDAERNAIVRECPLHNIHHKKNAKEAQRKAIEKLTATAQAKRDLTARIAYFNPVYSVHDAAAALSVNVRLVRQWIREGKIGYFTMPSKTGKPVPYISGWQLIEHIESMMNDDAARPDDLAIRAPAAMSEHHANPR
jgi:predicted GIY-YIG superfamily endonuclease